MKQTDQSAVFADFLGKTYATEEERGCFERDLAKLVASAKLLKQLEDIREAKRMTKAEVARRLGVKRPVVSRLLAGKGTVPNLGTIADVAEALNVPTSTFASSPSPAAASATPPLRSTKPRLERSGALPASCGGSFSADQPPNSSGPTTKPSRAVPRRILASNVTSLQPRRRASAT